MKRRIATGPIVAAISIAVWVLASACGMKSERDNRAGETSPAAAGAGISNTMDRQGHRISAILLVNFLSCPCTKEHCQVAEEVLLEAKRRYGDLLTYETVDWELEHEKAAPLREEYDVLFLPTLIVLDEAENVIWRCDNFYEEEEVYSKFEQLIREGG